MTKKKVEIQVKYWYLSSKHDYETMLSLFRTKHYSDALFYGHIVLEKILKALVVINRRESAPLIHDLIILVKLTKLELGAGDKKLLQSVYYFNIRSRYPDYKLEFYKICDYSYTSKYLNRIIALYHALCRHLKQKLSPNDLPGF